MTMGISSCERLVLDALGASGLDRPVKRTLRGKVGSCVDDFKGSRLKYMQK
jgi:hypothetical protein